MKAIIFAERGQQYWCKRDDYDTLFQLRGVFVHHVNTAS